jgi:hypothetical protein
LAAALQEEDRLIQAVEYHGVRFGEALRGRFGFLLHRYLRETLDHLELAEAVVACERPDLLMIVYEEGPYGRAAIIAGHRHGIPTLALQHGTLSGPFLPAYYFRRVSTDVRHDPIACPIPTCTAVYGQTTKEMLTRVSTYPEESVAVIGMPTYDAVIRSVVGLASEKVQTELGLRIGEPVVLVLSQPFLSNENRQFFINLVLVGAQQNAEVKWVVKLHPGESSEDWRAAIRTYGVGNVKLAKGQLHQWLVACRLVVAWFSTAILEAVVYAKPVITVRIPACQNADCYVEDGIVQAVGDQEELVRAVRALLRGGTTYAGAVGRSRANLDAHVFQPDGHAAERMTRLVGRLIDGRRQAGQSLPRGAENQ